MPYVPTGLSGLVREHTVPASTAAHQPAHSLPLTAGFTMHLRSQGKTFLRGLETLSLSHPAWHHYTNDFIRMRKRWQLVVKLWGHQKEGVNSSRIRVPSSTHTLPGSSKRCIPLGWWHRPGRARGTLCISLYSFGLILTCIVFLLKMLFINKKAFLILYLFFCYITDSVWIILFT